MHYTNLAFQLIHSDIIKFSQSNRKEGTMLRCTNLTFKRFNQMSLSQSNIKGKSNMLSYPTERPVTSYRIKIISRRYRSTLKCFLSPHQSRRQSSSLSRKTEGETSSGEPWNRRLSHWFSRGTENTQAIWCHWAQQSADEHDEHMRIRRCDLVPFLHAKKANVPTLGPRFLVKFPRVGKAIEVKCRTYARGPPRRA